MRPGSGMAGRSSSTVGGAATLVCVSWVCVNGRVCPTPPPAPVAAGLRGGAWLVREVGFAVGRDGLRVVEWACGCVACMTDRGVLACMTDMDDRMVGGDGCRA